MRWSDGHVGVEPREALLSLEQQTVSHPRVDRREAAPALLHDHDLRAPQGIVAELPAPRLRGARRVCGEPRPVQLEQRGLVGVAEGADLEARRGHAGRSRRSVTSS
jgi:hypothetical protein